MTASSDTPAVATEAPPPQADPAAKPEKLDISAAAPGQPALAEHGPPPSQSQVEEAEATVEFQGEVQTDNSLPSLETLQKLERYNVQDADGKAVSFKTLYAGHNAPRRVLIIFVRHFFCGMCQQYLRTLSASITPESLLQLPVSTFITVVGCGAPGLIKSYIEKTGCPFPVYADPTRGLYNELGMVKTLALGPQPAYMKGRSLASTVVSGIAQGLKQIRSGLVTKMGDQRQVGGEFLFEPASMTLESPVSTPADEKSQPRFLDEDDRLNTHENEKVEEKRVTWCHRMRTTRDHAEIPEIMEVLGLEYDEVTASPVVAKRHRHGHHGQHRGLPALQTRKGTGLSMASQMGSMRSQRGDRESVLLESPVEIDGNGNGNGNGIADTVR